MSPWRRVFPPTVVALLAVVLLGQVLVLDGVVRREARPHRAPVAFVANPVVADALARTVSELEGEPLQAIPIGEERRARAEVRRGRLVAAVLVDLRGVEDDVVLVSSAADPSLVEGVLDQVGVEQHGGYDLVAVAVQRVRSHGPGAFDFNVLGPSVAFFAVPVGGTPQFLDVRDLGPDSADTTRPMWGAASAAADGWIYSYGTASEPGAFGFALHVARSRLDDLVAPARWEYWNGVAWQRDASASVPVIGARGGTSQTLSVFRVAGRDGASDTWYAVSKRGSIGPDLVVWSAPTPAGPFTAGPPVARLESELGGQFRYMPLAHPGLLPEPGTVVVSWSNNSTDVGEIIDDPRRYRIQFLRIPLPSGGE